MALCTMGISSVLTCTRATTRVALGSSTTKYHVHGNKLSHFHHHTSSHHRYIPSSAEFRHFLMLLFSHPSRPKTAFAAFAVSITQSWAFNRAVCGDKRHNASNHERFLNSCSSTWITDPRLNAQYVSLSPPISTEVLTAIKVLHTPQTSTPAGDIASSTQELPLLINRQSAPFPSFTPLVQ